MSHKNLSKQQKTHPIDQKHSLTGVRTSDGPVVHSKDTNHSIKPSYRVNPHATFSPRTTLSKGRGK